MADGTARHDVGGDVTEPEGSSASPFPTDFAGQMRAFTERMMAGWTAATGTAHAAPPALPPLPKMPATMSADQIQSLMDDLAARRAQVQALTTQLKAFDEQLGTLEASVRPFLEWTRTWADLEKTMSEFWRPPSGGSGR
jgi:polyhydroxyalkanoate synthesis regulator phasin